MCCHECVACIDGDSSYNVVLTNVTATSIYNMAQSMSYIFQFTYNTYTILMHDK